MITKRTDIHKITKFNHTSTPYRKFTPSADSLSSELSEDLGYCTYVQENSSSSYQTDQTVFPDSSCDDRYLVRKTLRGKRRVDIISALINFEQSNYILKMIIGYLDYKERIDILRVSRNWRNIRRLLPRLFEPSFIYQDKENSTVFLKNSMKATRFPLSPLVTTVAQKSARELTSDIKEYLHACPICSGPAFYRPGEWQNRLHCRSSNCGVSVCFGCHREHSPSERCPDVNHQRVQLPSPPLVPVSPRRSPRSRRRRDKMTLRRL